MIPILEGCREELHVLNAPRKAGDGPAVPVLVCLGQDTYSNVGWGPPPGTAHGRIAINNGSAQLHSQPESRTLMTSPAPCRLDGAGLCGSPSAAGDSTFSGKGISFNCT